MGLDDASTDGIANSSSIEKINDVIVLGTCIIDCMSYVPHLPVTGETLRASRYQTGYGGKGANQCVSAAKLGSKTVLISKLGNDEWGDKYRENLEKYNVSTNYVETVNGKSTGLAQINVAENGDNQIVIIPGANDVLSAADVEKAQDVLDSSKVLVCQLETPLQATLVALRKFKNGISILNASPAPNENTLELFTLPTILCINQVEAAAMSKRAVPNIEEAKRAISNFLCLGCHTVIITLGKDGAIFASSAEPKPIHVKTPRVEEVLDTTGAGDAFVGALAHYLAKYPDLPLYRKVGGACQIASMSVQQYGTQSSYPLAKDLRFDITLKNFDWSYV